MKTALALLVIFTCLPVFGQRFIKTVNTIADLVAAPVHDIHTNVFVVDTNRGGLFVLVANQTGTNTGTKFASATAGYSWNRQVVEPLNVRWFGAVGSGIATDDAAGYAAAIDDGPAFTNALAAATTLGVHIVQVPMHQVKYGDNRDGYVIKCRVIIPEDVELSGIAPEAAQWNNDKTMPRLLTAVGKNEVSGYPFIRLLRRSSLQKMVVYYPDQAKLTNLYSAVIEYSPTIKIGYKGYAIPVGNHCEGPSVKFVNLENSYDGIDCGDDSQAACADAPTLATNYNTALFTIEGNYINPIRHGITFDSCAGPGFVKDNFVGNGLWGYGSDIGWTIRTGGLTSFPNETNKCIGYYLKGKCDDIMFSGNVAIYCYIGYRLCNFEDALDGVAHDPPWAEFNGCLADDCSRPMVIDACMRCTVSGGSYVKYGIGYPGFEIGPTNEGTITITGARTTRGASDFYGGMAVWNAATSTSALLVVNSCDFGRNADCPAVLNTGNGLVSVSSSPYASYTNIVGSNIRMDGIYPPTVGDEIPYLYGTLDAATNISLSVYDPATDTGWQLVNTGGDASSTLALAGGGVTFTNAIGLGSCYFVYTNIANPDCLFTNPVFWLQYDVQVLGNGEPKPFYTIQTLLSPSVTNEWYSGIVSNPSRRYCLRETNWYTLRHLMILPKTSPYFGFSIETYQNCALNIKNLKLYKAEYPIGYTGREYFRDSMAVPFMTIDENRHKVFQYTAAPTVAFAFAVGDRVINTSPSATAYAGWICVSAGTPGTWKGYGQIEP